MTRGILRTAILTTLVVAAGLAAWALFQTDEDHADPPTDRSDDAAFQDEPSVAADLGTTPGGAPDSARTNPGSRAPGVPRLLPADAALEDLRDALALEGDGRAAALAEAWQATGRVVARHGKVRREMHALIESEEDPLLRAVATSALGTDRSDANERWLRVRLGTAAAVEQRVGALVALAHPDADAGRPREGTVRVAALGGLACAYAALPEGASMRAATVQFLDATDGAEARDTLPVLVLAVRTSRDHAAALVTDGGKLRRFVRSLPVEDQRRLRDAARTHADLPRLVTRALEKID